MNALQITPLKRISAFPLRHSHCQLNLGNILPPGRSSSNLSLFSTSWANLSANCKDKDCSLEGSVLCITMHSVGSSMLAMSSSLMIILATMACTACFSRSKDWARDSCKHERKFFLRSFQWKIKQVVFFVKTSECEHQFFFNEKFRIR